MSNYPTKRTICPRCDGYGHHGNPVFDGSSMSIFEGEPELADDYFTGRLDVPCETCQGGKIVSVVDTDACTPEQLVALQEQEYDDYCDRQMRLAEMRMGA